MYSLSELQETIEQRLQKLPMNDRPEGLYEPIRYALSNGGKRIRPALTLMACNLFDDTIDHCISAALSIEVFHNFTLLHDDIMDHADLRRNRPTVHKKWDINHAILSGDAMFIKAYGLLLNTPADKLKQVLDVFNDTALEVCEGQQYDMNFETLDNVQIDEYLEMIKLKTAVLIAGSLKVGAIIGGAAIEEANKLYEFGKNLGLAFQLQDDLLDAYGDANKFGKKIGGDILENKKTFLLIKAFELADEANLSVLNHYIPGKNPDPNEKIAAILKVYDKLKIRALTQKKIDGYFEIARAKLAEINVKESRKSKLSELAEKLIHRTF